LSRTSHWPKTWSLTSATREDLDLSQSENIEKKLSVISFDLILNAAAYTQVDLAEKETAVAETINFTAPTKIAEFCAENGKILVHFSSDYVYAGNGNFPQTESTPIEPRNFYGESKALADNAISRLNFHYLIFRTSWVYSAKGKNFVKTMLKLSLTHPTLKVVSDQVGVPTYARDLALYTVNALKAALEKPTFPAGIYHLTNQGEASWFDFAKAILPEHSIEPILTKDYPTPARRPLNSRLSLEKFESTFNLHPRNWRLALADCLKEISTESKTS
jgi:dTDP-4-dehydrorhamnose reductase